MELSMMKDIRILVLQKRIDQNHHQINHLPAVFNTKVTSENYGLPSGNNYHSFKFLNTALCAIQKQYSEQSSVLQHYWETA